MKPFIVCEHVDFGYENQDAVMDLSMEIHPGDYLCIVGSNGEATGFSPTITFEEGIKRTVNWIVGQG